MRDEEAGHLARVRLPALLASGGAAVAATRAPAHPSLEGTPFAESLRAVVDLFEQSEAAAGRRADQSAKAALKASVRTLQGLASEQQLTVSQMQEEHDDPRVLQGLLEIDHMNAQFGRRAQAIAILCGSWPGRQRAAASLLDVIRGATSRIRDYRRVEVNAQLDIALVSRAVEPVVLALAELLDNAARHSQPNTKVQVTVMPTHNGTSIVIDDAGVGLHPREIQQASELLSRTDSVDVTKLGDPPQFGFAVIGVLAQRYGFSVSVDTRSPFGGVRAVLFLPGTLFTAITPEDPVPRPTPPRPPHQPAHAVTEPAAAPAVDTGGLPQRRRRQPLPDAAGSPQPAPEGRSAASAAAVVGAFARGTRSGRTPAPNADSTPTPDARPAATSE